MFTYYDFLGVAPTVSLNEIEKAYRAKAVLTHPDRNPAPDATQCFQLLQRAYSVLASSENRRWYNKEISAVESPFSPVYTPPSRTEEKSRTENQTGIKWVLLNNVIEIYIDHWCKHNLPEALDQNRYKSVDI